jgi:hypothetical protein
VTTVSPCHARNSHHRRERTTTHQPKQRKQLSGRYPVQELSSCVPKGVSLCLTLPHIQIESGDTHTPQQAADVRCSCQGWFHVGILEGNGPRCHRPLPPRRHADEQPGRITSNKATGTCEWAKDGNLHFWERPGSEIGSEATRGATYWEEPESGMRPVETHRGLWLAADCRP